MGDEEKVEKVDRVVRVAAIDLFDGSRGLMFHKGTFVEAPREFFKRYDPIDMVIPKVAFNSATDFKMNITEYTGMEAENRKKEVVKLVVKAPDTTPGPPAAAPAAEAPAAAPAAEPTPDKAPALTGDNASALKGRGKKKKNG